MGYVEIIRPTEKKMYVISDGKEQVVDIEFCDACETWQQENTGTYTRVDGEPVLWHCAQCEAAINE